MREVPSPHLQLSIFAAAMSHTENPAGSPSPAAGFMHDGLLNAEKEENAKDLRRWPVLS